MKLLIFILLFSFSVFTKAEDKTRAIDLKAAYCIKSQKDFLSIINTLVQTDEELKSSIYQNPKNKNEQEFNEKIIKDNEERIERVENLKYIINRLEGYLNPRLKFIDNASILNAIKQVEKDKAMIASCMKKNNCNLVTESKKFDVCMSECNKKFGNIDKKVDECSDLSWLPY
jgi:hypothetical protein